MECDEKLEKRENLKFNIKHSFRIGLLDGVEVGDLWLPKAIRATLTFPAFLDKHVKIRNNIIM
jgi:hypothetical protein